MVFYVSVDLTHTHTHTHTHIFTLKERKKVFWIFMNFEKTYDRTDNSAVRLYEVGGRLLSGVKSFHWWNYVREMYCIVTVAVQYS